MEATLDTKTSSLLAQAQDQAKAAQEQSLAWQKVANEAASNLVLIESKFAPILGRKINFFNALLHIQMYVELIKEVIELIRNFKAKYVTPPQDATPAN